MIEILSENLAAGELKTFTMQGGYFEVLDAQYPLDVFLLDRSGAVLSVMRKAEASFFSRPGQFETFQIQSAVAQAVRFFIGSGDAGTRRSAGVVQVVDAGYAQVLSNQAFMGAASVNPGTATNNGAVQLWNLAGSGKNLVVEQISGVSSTVCGVSIVMGSSLGGIVGMTPSKLANGANSIAAQLRQGDAPPGGWGSFGAARGSLGFDVANKTIFYTPKVPFVVPPGYGLTLIDTATVAHTTTIGFEHREVPA